jgi:DNA polymerase-3 subunit alpha
MEAYRSFASAIKAPTFRSILAGDVPDGKKITVVGMITSVRLRSIRNDGIMANVVLEDVTGSLGITAFNRTVSDSKHLITEGNILMVTGRVQEREDRPFELMADRFEPISPAAIKNPPKKQVKKGLYLRVESIKGEEMTAVKTALAEFGGDTPVYVVEASGKRLLAPESLWVTPDQRLISELKEILGQENVKNVE